MKQTNTNSQEMNRRRFIGIAGGITFLASASLLLPKYLSEEENSPDPESLATKEVSVWVNIREDGQITIFNPASEMGQGSMTALAIIIAEEMDADWSKVIIQNSAIEPDIYGAGWDGSPGGTMITVGSRTIRSYYQNMRQAGAQVRYILMSNVARQFNVPIEELDTEPGFVVHHGNKKKWSYGEISTFAKPIESLPTIPAEKLKDPAEFRLIGKVKHRFDVPEKVDGSATYGIDIQLPGMLYGVISRSPVHGTSPTLQNEESILKLAGVVKVVHLEHGIGVIAQSITQAIAAKAKLEIEWSTDSIAINHNSETAYEDYVSIAEDDSVEGNLLEDKGNTLVTLKNGQPFFIADYKNDPIYHAQMEPLNAVVLVSPDGNAAEVWAGTQGPDGAKSAVAKTLGIEFDQVTFHPLYLGGGFGRRSNPDYIIEATQLAKEVSQPVKLIWTREDDLQYGMYRPMSLQRMQASLDEAGNIKAWWHLIIGTGGRLLASGAKTSFYTIPNQRIEVRNVDHGIRTKHWRAVGHGPNKYAIEAFVDEIANALGKDPLDYRLQLMKDHPRAQKVLNTVALMSNWSKPIAANRAKGMAFAERSGSLGACVCELSIDETTGQIKVHHIWSAVDAGVVIQPDNVVAQMEGGFIMGLSSLFKEKITIENGKVQESNFHNYPILRMNEIPESITVKIIESNESPTGVGESSTPLIGGAVANAFAKLTGKNLRHLPFTPEKVKAILNT